MKTEDSAAPAIRELHDDTALRTAWPVVRQLRPHLDEAGFLARVAQQRAEGYRVVALCDEAGVCVAFAGFRLASMLARGKALYVDDLVTADGTRSRGHGARLLRWLVAESRRLGCERLHLDSGVQRHAAHRFYLRHGFDISAHHFGLALDDFRD